MMYVDLVSIIMAFVFICAFLVITNEKFMNEQHWLPRKLLLVFDTMVDSGGIPYRSYCTVVVGSLWF